MTETPPRLDDPNFEKLTEHIQGMLKKMEDLPFPKVQEDVFELLNCLDLMHREVFTRLIEMVETQAPHVKLDMANDYAVQTVMMLYGFVPDDAPLAEAGNVATKQSNSVVISFDAIPIKEPPPISMPIWIPLGALGDMQPGELRARKVEERDLVICRVGDEMFALDNHGADTILPLDRGTLNGYWLHDPWHNVDYDVRTGEMQGNVLRVIESYPVVVSKDGKYRVGFNISKKAAAFLAQTKKPAQTE